MQVNGYSEREPSPLPLQLWIGSNIIFGGLLLFYSIYQIISSAVIDTPWIAGWLSGSTPSFVEGLMIAVRIIVMLGAAVIIIKLFDMPLMEGLPMKRPGSPGVVLAAVGCCLGASVIGVYFSGYVVQICENVVGAAYAMPGMIPGNMTDKLAVLLRIIAITIVPAVFEEVLFRGAVLQPLRRCGDSFAIIMSSVLFAFSHKNLEQGPNAFVVGLVFGYFAIRTGSLITPIIMHLANNVFAALLIIVTPGLSDGLRLGVNLGYLLFSVAAGLARAPFMQSKKNCCSYPERKSEKPLTRSLIFFTTPAAVLYFIVTIRAIMSYFE